MKQLEKDQRQKALRCIAGALILIIVWMISGVADITEKGICLLLFLMPYILVGYDVVASAFENIVKGKFFDECFLMVIATVGAFAIGEYPEAVAVLLFYQIGELLQDVAVERSKKTVEALLNIKPENAVVIRGGKEIKVLPEDVAEGEVICIRPGERIPLDGIIISGKSVIDTSALTGEAAPKDVKEGDEVLSGGINILGLIKIKTTSVYENSTVARILDIARNAAEKKSKPEKFITKFARVYTPAVVICALMLAFIPPLITGAWSEWIRRACMFLVVSCPCALVISVPLSFFCGIGAASSKGILIKGANCIEALSNAKTFIFDKTGTLTKGSFVVMDIRPNGIGKEELLCLAAYAECYSVHPIARSVINAYGKEINKNIIESYEEIAGKGIKTVIAGKTVFAGNVKPDGAGEEYGTCVYIYANEEYLGCIVIADELKKDSADTVKKLKDFGMNTVMLTGDTKSAANFAAKSTGVSEARCSLLPDEKAKAIKEYSKNTVFIGDGINDSPAMISADVGIAMGLSGSDAAIEASDMVIMDDKPSKVITAYKLSEITMKTVRQNIVFSLVIKATILILSAFGITGMWFAVFADVGVTFLAVLNAVRILYNTRNDF